MDSNTPILATLLLMAACMGFVLFLIKVTVPRIFRRVLDHYGRRLEIAEQIMNTRRAPAVWLRQEMARMEKASNPQTIQRLQAQACRTSLKRLDAIIKFLKNANTFDTPETKHMVLTELVQVRREWQAHGWASVEPDPDYILLRDRDAAAGGSEPAAGSDSEA